MSLYGRDTGRACLATDRVRELGTTRCRDIGDGESAMVATRARWRVETCSGADCSAANEGTAKSSKADILGDGRSRSMEVVVGAGEMGKTMVGMTERPLETGFCAERGGSGAAV